MVIEDWTNELTRFPLEDIAAVVSNHVRTGKFFPVLSEIYGPLSTKAEGEWRRRRAFLDRQKDLPAPEVTAEQRRRCIEHWESVKQTFSGFRPDEPAVDLSKMPCRVEDDGSYNADDLAAILEADRADRARR